MGNHTRPLLFCFVEPELYVPVARVFSRVFHLGSLRRGCNFSLCFSAGISTSQIEAVLDCLFLPLLANGSPAGPHSLVPPQPFSPPLSPPWVSQNTRSRCIMYRQTHPPLRNEAHNSAHWWQTGFYIVSCPYSALLPFCLFSFLPSMSLCALHESFKKTLKKP